MEKQLEEINTYKAKDFKSFLQEELIKRCRKNPNYSLRSFAKYLNVSHSALTEMMNGKRTITKKSMEKFGPILGLSLSDIKVYQETASPMTSLKPENETSYQQLTLDQFAVMSDWYHYAILELIKIKKFPHTTSAFSKALGISKSEANIAVQRMMRIGLLETDDQGKYIEINGGFATNITGNLTSMGSKKLQKEILEQSIEALVTIPIELRNHTSMTMAIDPKLIPEAIKRIAKFRRELSVFLETEGESTEVYQLAISLFPITQNKTNDLLKENVCEIF